MQNGGDLELRAWFLEYVKEAQELFERVLVNDRSGGLSDFNQGLSEALKILGATTLSQKVILIGNGGSAGIASEVSNRLWKFCGIKGMTFNDPVILTSTANDYGQANIFLEPLKTFYLAGDLLIAISSSGKSEDILRAADFALNHSMNVITLSGFSPQNPLRKTGHINFYVPSQLYRHVERTHLFILDCVIDYLIVLKELGRRGVGNE